MNTITTNFSYTTLGALAVKRSSNVVGNAVLVAKIVTGEVEEVSGPERKSMPKKRKGGLKGGKARATSFTSEQRSEIAARAANARWRKSA